MYGKGEKIIEKHLHGHKSPLPGSLGAQITLLKETGIYDLKAKKPRSKKANNLSTDLVQRLFLSYLNVGANFCANIQLRAIKAPHCTNSPYH